MLTSRFKFARPDEMADEASSRTVELRLDGTMKEYSIEPLDKADAMKLLDHELGIVKVGILYSFTSLYKEWYFNWFNKE